MAEKALTTGEVAKFCSVNVLTVNRWIKRGLLKAYKLPGRGDNRIQVKDFVAFVQKNNMPMPDEYQALNRRVLIVEDEPGIAKIIQTTLVRDGFETKIAPDGFSAGSLLWSFAPSLMTLDLKIPGINGLEVLKIVKGTPKLEHVKILVVSAMPKAQLEEALSAGADDVLEKPFTTESLKGKISALSGVA